MKIQIRALPNIYPVQIVLVGVHANSNCDSFTRNSPTIFLYDATIIMPIC
jgi:hypothetical protein